MFITKHQIESAKRSLESKIVMQSDSENLEIVTSLAFLDCINKVTKFVQEEALVKKFTTPMKDFLKISWLNLVDIVSKKSVFSRERIPLWTDWEGVLMKYEERVSNAKLC